MVSAAKAEALGLTPVAELAGFGMVAGPDPSLLTQPSRAIKHALARYGRKVTDVDLFEINEAFAAVSAASMADLGIDDDIVNVNGGAIALGHPIGMSGTRLVITLGRRAAPAGRGSGGGGAVRRRRAGRSRPAPGRMTAQLLDGGFARQLPDGDAGLTGEWLESLDDLVDAHGPAAARVMLTRLLGRAAERDVGFRPAVGTPYVNTIPPEDEPTFPGDPDLERRIEAYVRWNAAVMVTRANAHSDGIGGHMATPASSTTLYEIGFNHFFRGKDGDRPGDQVFFQGHATPGIYARAFIEGRLREDQVDRFRREIGGGGLSSYPHPRLMPDFWEFPTVSMGIGPICAIYQARFNRYLANRGIVDTSGSKVWCFVGDGECDEPETLGALSIAAREGLDNLIFVVNCNLQRLDGPVRGNGKIVQELESVFRGAGWNAVKVVWGSRWDELLAADASGVLLDRMNSTLDGEFQKYAVEGPAFVREHFFGADPRLRAHGRGPARRRSALHPAPRRPRPREGARRLRRGHGARGGAQRHPGQDDQGRRPGQGGRGPQCLAPDEEAAPAAARRPARPARPRRPDQRRGPRGQAAAVLLPAGGLGRARRTCTTTSGPRAGRSPAGCCGPAPPACRRRPRSTTSSAVPASARYRPPWPSPACSSRCSGTRPSAGGWCRSSPTRAARSASTHCSAR